MYGWLGGDPDTCMTELMRYIIALWGWVDKGTYGMYN